MTGHFWGEDVHISGGMSERTYSHSNEADRGEIILCSPFCHLPPRTTFRNWLSAPRGGLFWTNTQSLPFTDKTKSRVQPRWQRPLAKRTVTFTDFPWLVNQTSPASCSQHIQNHESHVTPTHSTSPFSGDHKSNKGLAYVITVLKKSDEMHRWYLDNQPAGPRRQTAEATPCIRHTCCDLVLRHTWRGQFLLTKPLAAPQVRLLLPEPSRWFMHFLHQHPTEGMNQTLIKAFVKERQNITLSVY